MRMCKQCRYADRTEDRQMRRCPYREEVRADQAACERYAVSAYAFLESVARAEKRLRSMALRAQEYREMASRATGRMEASRTSGTCGRSRVEQGVNACVDIAMQIESQASRLRERHAQALAMIEDVQSAEGRRVLEMRHLERREWSAIARELGYDVRQAQRIHRRSLCDVQAQMDALHIRV